MNKPEFFIGGKYYNIYSGILLSKIMAIDKKGDDAFGIYTVYTMMDSSGEIYACYKQELYPFTIDGKREAIKDTFIKLTIELFSIEESMDELFPKKGMNFFIYKDIKKSLEYGLSLVTTEGDDINFN